MTWFRRLMPRSFKPVKLLSDATFCHESCKQEQTGSFKAIWSGISLSQKRQRTSAVLAGIILMRYNVGLVTSPHCGKFMGKRKNETVGLKLDMHTTCNAHPHTLSSQYLPTGCKSSITERHTCCDPLMCREVNPESPETAAGSPGEV